MSIFLNKNSKVIVQGITGGEGSKHTALMLKAGTQVVGGVNARKAGETVTHAGADGQSVTLPVFGTVEEAIRETGADVSIVFVPPAFAKDAVVEAIEAEIPMVVVITEGIPIQDSAEFWALAQAKGNLGFSTAIGIGGDPIIGTTHIDALAAFQDDPDTKAIVMIGEIGGDAEERAADFIRANVTKPVVAYVAGFTAPEGKTMGHAGAIVSSGAGTAQGKKEALEAAGVKVGKTPSETATLMREVLASL
jgi:succinyl-CoA synthetase alpha subunit